MLMAISLRLFQILEVRNNYNKKGLLNLLELIQSNQVEKVVILYKDRLLRFGYELFENVCKYYNTKIEIIDNTEKSDKN